MSLVTFDVMIHEWFFNMTFFFGEIEGERAMVKINLRDIESRANQWDHPIKGLLKFAKAAKEAGGDILKVSKKDRERYCVSLVALALQEDTKFDWWTHLPNLDTPDGLVMTFYEEKPGSFRGHMRGIEVVEHRGEPSLLFNTIQKKLVENVYSSDSILVCLILTPGMYDMLGLAVELAKVPSSMKHIFAIFSGVQMSGDLPTVDQLKTTFTMVQLVPTSLSATFDLRPSMDDFTKRYEKGQESRLIENSKVFYATANKKLFAGI